MVRLKKIMPKNKKGWMRILEAFIAVLIILTSIVVLYNNQGEKVDISQQVYDKQTRIIKMMINNDTLREWIINEDEEAIEDYVLKLVPSNWNYTISICELNDICPGKGIPYDSHKEIYTNEALVTSTVETYSPKKLRFFVWMK